MFEIFNSDEAIRETDDLNDATIALTDPGLNPRGGLDGFGKSETGLALFFLFSHLTLQKICSIINLAATRHRYLFPAA